MVWECWEKRKQKLRCLIEVFINKAGCEKKQWGHCQKDQMPEKLLEAGERKKGGTEEGAGGEICAKGRNLPLLRKCQVDRE